MAQSRSKFANYSEDYLVVLRSRAERRERISVIYSVGDKRRSLYVYKVQLNDTVSLADSLQEPVPGVSEIPRIKRT